MKKLFLLGVILILLSGCSSIENSSLDHILSSSINSRVHTTNVNRNGYRYYLPKGLFIKSSKEFNEIISDQKYFYYLYVDIVSYDSEIGFSYTVNQEAYYSASLVHQDKNGFIEINNYENDQYLIEIMYNYAKIEVIVEKEDINKSVTNAMIVLSTITYTDDIVKNLLSIDEVTSSEEKFSVFDEDASDSNFLEVYKEYGNYEGDDKVPDLDVIK